MQPFSLSLSLSLFAFRALYAVLPVTFGHFKEARPLANSIIYFRGRFDS